MAKEILRPTDYDKLSDKQKVLLSGLINLNIWNLEISWDLDQTLAITEEPIKTKCDNDFGTNYKDRKVDGYGNISKWLLEDKVFTHENDAKDYENKIWADPNILIPASPNQALQNLSYAAYHRGIPQSVVTVRVPALRQATHKWLGTHFPWIKAGNINMNIGGLISGAEFKVNVLKDQFAKNPNLVHLDDDMNIVRMLVGSVPNINVIGIIYPSDQIDDLRNVDSRVFISRDELNHRIYYGSQNITDFSRTM